MFRSSLRLFRDMAIPKKGLNDPLIVIVGATGTGKSQLAIDLATRFNGEVVNGDAMQMYDGLPIITNKLSREEQQCIPHHLLGIVPPDEGAWRVGDFKKRATSAIKEIRSRGKLPILVGGTHYYVQAFLFKDVLVSEDGESEEAGEGLSRDEINRRHPILEKPTEQILAQLREVDPVMADRWHPNDRRKIQRSLEIYLTTGKLASRVYEEQKLKKTLDQEGVSGTDSSEVDNVNQLRSTIIFWVHAERDNLRARLDARVDKMLQSGLLNEVESLDTILKQANLSGVHVDRSSGIWVSIGFKEFGPYINALKGGAMSSEDLKVALTDAVERTKAATRQYAKRQIQWIRVKLLSALYGAQALQNLYLLDGSNLDQWSASVSRPAIEIVEKFLAQEELPAPVDMSPTAAEFLTPKQTFQLGDRPDLWVRETCELCDMTAVTNKQWQVHLKSRGHRRAVKKSEVQNALRKRSWIQDNESLPEKNIP